MSDDRLASINDFIEFFGIKGEKAFCREWAKLGIWERIDLLEGIGNGSLTY